MAEAKISILVGSAVGGGDGHLGSKLPSRTNKIPKPSLQASALSRVPLAATPPSSASLVNHVTSAAAPSSRGPLPLQSSRLSRRPLNRQLQSRRGAAANRRRSLVVSESSSFNINGQSASGGDNLDRSSSSQQLRAASAPSAPSVADDRLTEDDNCASMAASSRPIHLFERHWEFQSERVTRGPARLPLQDKPRSVPITVHGCSSEEDALWLQEQVLSLDGVHEVFIQGVKAGGLRGGAVTLQLEVDSTVKLPSLVDQVHCIEERLLVLPFKTRSWDWKGHRISYAVAGCGKPVILVHGFGGNAGHFRNLIAQLADSHRVYAVDLLGFGNSAKPADVDYGPDLWADIINDFAAEFADEPPVLIGNSIGSLTALAAANRIAQRGAVRGLVLLNVAGAMNRKGLMQDDLLLTALSPIFIGIEYLLKKPKVASFLFERFRNKANVRKILAQQVYRDLTAVDDRLLDILYEPSQDEGAIDVFVKVFTGEPGPRPEQLVEQLHMPMLVLWGDADPWTPINGKVAQVFRQLEVERGNVRVVPLADVGHCPHDDRPELAVSHILPWLDELDSLDSADL